MSVIGTTLKQPRVFAHDAVALQDLPGCTWRGVKEVTMLTPGTGFVAGEDIPTWLSTPITTSNAGNGLIITVDTITGPDDEVDEFSITNFCSWGNAYNVGDIVTINSPTLGGEPATFQVDDLQWSLWGYGCPFTTAYMKSSSILIEDITDANVGEPLYGKSGYTPPTTTRLGEGNVNGELGQIDQLSGFLKKTMYTIGCECGAEGVSPECNCTYETPGPGAALYIGAEMTEITVIMESGSKTTFHNIPAGSFLPISALTVCDATATDEGVDEKEVILALF